MPLDLINVGGAIADPTADITRDAFIKANTMFTELYRNESYTSDRTQTALDQRSTVIMRGDNLTYTLQNNLAWADGITFRIIQDGTGFSIDDTAVTLNVIGGELKYIDGSHYYITKIGESGGTDIYTVVVISPTIEAIGIAISDETTPITTGTAKATFRMPYKFELLEVRASLTTAVSGSDMTLDINEDATTILSTKLTIDAGEKTSVTATTAAVISDTSLADDSEITIDVDSTGTAATGGKIWLIGYRS